MAEIIKIQKQQQLLKRVNTYLIDYFKIAVVVILLLILLLGYFLILLPRYKQIADELAATKSTQAIQQAHYKVYLESLNKLNLTYSQLDQNKLERIKIMLPDEPRPEQLMMELQKITEDNGVVLSSLTVSPDDINYIATSSTQPMTDAEVAKLSLGQVNIGINIIGLGYAGLKNLLGVFENNLRLMDINSLSWSPDSKSAKLDITAYYLKR